MRGYGVTIRQAAEMWVHEMNAIPYDMIEKLYERDPCSWREITMPSISDSVYVNGEGSGTIAGVKETDDGKVYEVVLDESLLKDVYGDEFEKPDRVDRLEVPEAQIYVERDSLLPMWGTMWSFGDGADNWWLDEMGGVEIMSECGFRVYESDDFGYFFGIDGAGYDFYESHWVPLYKARGLQWHDPMTEGGRYVMDESRRAELFMDILKKLEDQVPSDEMMREILTDCGLTRQEREYLGYAVVDEFGEEVSDNE